MADENTVDQDPIASGELADEAADQDISTELPDQPDELRAKATEVFKENADLKRSNRQATERAEELEASATYFRGKAKDLEEQLATRTAEPPQPRAPKPAEKPKPLLDRQKFDDILASDDGPQALEAIIEQVAERKAREMVTSSQDAASEQNVAQNAMVQRLSVQYPDILKPGSDLQAATGRHFTRLERERPSAARESLVELATLAAAVEIGYKPKSAGDPSAPSSERLRAAQSAPHGRKPDTKPSAAPVDPGTEKFAKKHGVPMDSVSRKIIADLQTQNARTARK